jgi:hypothetical protein
MASGTPSVGLLLRIIRVFLTVIFSLHSTRRRRRKVCAVFASLVAYLDRFLFQDCLKPGTTRMRSIPCLTLKYGPFIWKKRRQRTRSSFRCGKPVSTLCWYSRVCSPVFWRHFSSTVERDYTPTPNRFFFKESTTPFVTNLPRLRLPPSNLALPRGGSISYGS